MAESSRYRWCDQNTTSRPENSVCASAVPPPFISDPPPLPSAPTLCPYPLPLPAAPIHRPSSRCAAVISALSLTLDSKRPAIRLSYGASASSANSTLPRHAALAPPPPQHCRGFTAVGRAAAQLDVEDDGGGGGPGGEKSSRNLATESAQVWCRQAAASATARPNNHQSRGTSRRMIPNRAASGEPSPHYTSAQFSIVISESQLSQPSITDIRVTDV